MFAPTTTGDVRRVPLCPTCVAPMTMVRIVTPTPAAEFRIFACRDCGVMMFTEMGP